jgi:hypothetical protein
VLKPRGILSFSSGGYLKKKEILSKVTNRGILILLIHGKRTHILLKKE